MPYIGQRPSKGDENNFKILDDISSYTLTFDGSDASVVSAANDTITSLNHRFAQGQRVTYNKGGGSVIAGLSDGVYYIIKHDHHTIKLATSASNATNGIAVNITGVGGGSSHTLNVAFDGINTKFKATHTNGQKAKITRSAQLVISINGVIQQPHDSATPSTGFGFDLDGTIVLSQAPVAGDVYWAHVLTNNNVTFDISDNDVDNFTGDGSTVSFNLSKTPPDNRNILVTIDGVVQYPNDPDGTARAYNVVENVLTFTTAPDANVEIQVRHIGFAGSSSASGGVTNFYGRTGSVVLKNTDNIVANNAEFAGNLTVQGTMTTLDTKVTEVDQLEVGANNTTVGVAITQSGTGDILNLYDGSNKEFSVTDGGTVKISQSMAFQQSDRATTAGLLGRGSLLLAGTQQTDFAIRSVPHNSNLILGVGVTERLRIASDGKIGINTTDASNQLTVFAKSGSSVIARFKAFNGNSNFDIHTDASSHGQAYVRNNLGVTKVQLNSNGASYFTGGGLGIGSNTLFTSGAHSGTHQLTVTDNAPSMSLGVSNTDQLYVRRELANGKYTFQSVQSGGNNGVISLQPYGGSVGIGSATPAQKLDVVGNSVFRGEVNITSGNQIKLSNNANTANTTIDCDGGARLNLKSYNQSVATFEEGVGTIFYQSNNTARLTITPTGGVEVGAGGTIKIPDKIMHHGDEDTAIRFPSNDTITMETGGSERLRIDTSGRHLIGSPTSRFYAAKLQVQGTADSNYILMHNTSAGDADGNRYSKLIYSGTQSGGETSDLAHINASHDGTADDQKGRLEFRINTGAQNHSPVEALRIDSSCNMALGTITNAGNTLRYFDVGNYNTGSSAGSIIRLLTTKSDGTGAVGLDIVKYKSGGAYFNNYENIGTNGFISFGTAQNGGSVAESLRITSVGAVGINTTNPENHLLELYTAASADWKFRIHTNVSDGAGFYQRANGDFECVLRDASNNNNFISGNSGGLEFSTSGTEKLRIDSTGHTRIENDLNALAALNTASNYHLHLSNPANDVGEAVGICFGLSTGRDIGASIYHSRTGSMSYGDLMFATKPSGGGVTERLRITANGQTKLNISSNGALTEPLVIRNGGTGGGTNVGMIFYNGNESNSGAGALAKIKAIDTGNYDSDLVFETGLKSGWSDGGTTERLRITSDGLLKLAGLTLSQRNSATGVAGGLIYNSEGKIFQYHDGSGWITLNTTNQIVATGGSTVLTSGGYRIHDFQSNGTFEITSGVGEVEVLVVGGGGSEGGASSGCHAGGGGGGGGVVYKKMNMSAGKYTVTIGSGGLWRSNGGNTTFGSGTDHQIIALGGGAGGPTLIGNGNAGGSGGGGSRHDNTNMGGAATQPSSADGGFGNAGGQTGPTNTNPGGGGGAGGAGTSGNSGGAGGAGKQFTQFGVSIYFGAGGNAGGSAGAQGQTAGSTNGAGNTGAGAGGSSGGGTRYYGGSGRVMIRYPAAS